MLQHAADTSPVANDGSRYSARANEYAGTTSGLHISVRWILTGMVLGVALGILLSYFSIPNVAAQWVSLPGELFLRALKCFVVPYVFCSVAVAIGDIVFVGKVSVVGFQTAKVFGIMWLASVTIGVSVALLFRPLFRLHDAATPSALINTVEFTCTNQQTLEMRTDGSVFCSTHGDPYNATFTFYDLNKTFQRNARATLAQLRLTDQLMQMITLIVSDNIVGSLANGQLLSTITFAMVLGAIAGRNYFLRTRRTNYLYLTLVQLRNAFFLAMEWTIWLSPGAVVSIIAGSFAANQQALTQVTSVHAYLLAAFCAALVQMFLVFPLIVLLLTHCNPYTHMRHMVRAYALAFACSSSLATAPVTLACVRKARVCSQSLANFVISIGVTSNVSAAGTYFPVAVVFIAETSGNGGELTALRVVGIFVLSLLSCAGTPPIPASGLVTITTIYETVFGTSVMPASFAYVVAMDFLLDRFATVCDVNDDIMALKVIAETTDETVTQEVLGERK
jgi:Na+/H+-dicarboxylate symporter